MINPSTGEVAFQDGLVFAPHGKAPDLPLKNPHRSPAPGWITLAYGLRDSEYGKIEVGAVCKTNRSTYMVILRHEHPFYNQTTPGDSERQVFHENIVSKDLKGQREFSWGTIHISTDPADNKNYLVVIYTPETNVPDEETVALLRLFGYNKPA